MQLSALYKIFKDASGISTDTRMITEGAVFFALKGEHFNGNMYAEKALAAGACYAVIDELHFPSNEKFIQVNDTLESLQQLSAYHRNQITAKVIAIAGSNGKTTTKELISQVIGTSYKTFFTKGNLNNHIGVPLSLLSIKSDDRFAVIEMGANHIGETEFLCGITKPNFGLITNNGKDHLEGYGSIEGVRKGNGELYEFLRSENRLAFVSADEHDLMEMSSNMKRVTYGENVEADCKGRVTAMFPFLQLESGTIKIRSQLIGRYNFENIMAAVCIGKYFEIPEQQIVTAIESYRPSNNRSQLLNVGTNTFILDAYNANPSSMNAALDSFFQLPEKSKVVILGDMAELGAASDTEHRLIINRLTDTDLKHKIVVGEKFIRALPANRNEFLAFKNVAELKEWFFSQQFENHFFLLKGSRVIELEKLLS